MLPIKAAKGLRSWSQVGDTGVASWGWRIITLCLSPNPCRLNGSLPKGVEAQNRTLFFRGPINYSLAGTYVCEATNPIGTRSGQVEVNITGRMLRSSLPLPTTFFHIRPSKLPAIFLLYLQSFSHIYLQLSLIVSAPGHVCIHSFLEWHHSSSRNLYLLSCATANQFSN